MLRLVDDIAPVNLQITEDINQLAELYRKNILQHEKNDTIHLATASFYKLNIIASWNFRHIVNWKTIDVIHKINLENRNNLIEILSLENLGGDKYASI